MRRGTIKTSGSVITISYVAMERAEVPIISVNMFKNTVIVL